MAGGCERKRGGVWRRPERDVAVMELPDPVRHELGQEPQIRVGRYGERELRRVVAMSPAEGDDAHVLAGTVGSAVPLLLTPRPDGKAPAVPPRGARPGDAVKRAGEEDRKCLLLAGRAAAHASPVSVKRGGDPKRDGRGMPRGRPVTRMEDLLTV